LNQLHIDTWRTAQRSVPATLTLTAQRSVPATLTLTAQRSVPATLALTAQRSVPATLRPSKQTELQHEFPLHVVYSWLGNSPRIAQQSYLLAGVQKVLVE